MTVVSAGDDLGTRSGGPASGVTFTSFGNFFDLNNSGNLVFQAKVSGAQEGFYFWDGSTGQVKEVFRKDDTTDSLASEMITLNSLNQVAYVTGSTAEGATDDHSEGHEGDTSPTRRSAGVFFWKAGATQKAIAVGDVVGGNAVTDLYAQHQSFVRRQFNSVGCLATAYTVADDDAEMDCDEGDSSANCYTKSPLLFISCATSCPAILVAPPTLPGGAQGVAYSQTITATGGTGPYTFTLTSGALPTGMNPLSSGGVLSGTPTADGHLQLHGHRDGREPLHEQPGVHDRGRGAGPGEPDDLAGLAVDDVAGRDDRLYRHDQRRAEHGHDHHADVRKPGRRDRSGHRDDSREPDHRELQRDGRVHGRPDRDHGGPAGLFQRACGDRVCECWRGGSASRDSDAWNDGARNPGGRPCDRGCAADEEVTAADRVEPDGEP